MRILSVEIELVTLSGLPKIVILGGFFARILFWEWINSAGEGFGASSLSFGALTWLFGALSATFGARNFYFGATRLPFSAILR